MTYGKNPVTEFGPSKNEEVLKVQLGPRFGGDSSGGSSGATESNGWSISVVLHVRSNEGALYGGYVRVDVYIHLYLLVPENSF